MLKHFSMILCISIFFCGGCFQLAQASESLRIVVNIPSRVLQLYEGDRVKKEYPVGVGTKENKTPVGEFQILAKEINPIWIKPTKGDEKPVIIKSGADNPLGYRWIEFAELYGIHGTNNPDSIGGYVSNGCIRMHENDVEALYDLVPLRTPVTIVYHRTWIKKDEDNNITMEIYPDTYGIQQLTSEEIYRKLAVYGVQDFMDRGQLDRALQSGNRAAFSLGRTFSMMVFGKAIAPKAVEQDGQIYLPIFPVASEVMVDVYWDKESSQLRSVYGSVAGHDKNDVLYVKEKDIYALLHVYGNVNSDKRMIYLDYGKY